MEQKTTFHASIKKENDAANPSGAIPVLASELTIFGTVLALHVVVDVWHRVRAPAS